MLTFLVLLAQLVAALQSSHALEAVLLYHDGRIEAVHDRLTLTPDRMRDLRHAWLWSSRVAPTRIPVSRIESEQPKPATARLEVRVAGESPCLQEGVTLRAAPAEMWQEVPEDLLPSWRIAGAATVSVPLERTRRWRLRLIGESCGSWWADVPAGQNHAALAVEPSQPVFLAVRDIVGMRLPEVGLQIYEATPARRGGARHLAFFRGDDAGRLRLLGLPDRTELTWVIGDREHPPLTLRSRPSQLPAEVILPAGSALEGRVVDGAGSPLPDVEVRAEAWAGAEVPIAFSRSSLTDLTGRWRIAGLPSGSVSVWTRRKGYASVRKPVHLEGGFLDLGTWSLSPGASLRVHVVDDEGSPVVAASVQPAGGEVVFTDARGEAACAHLASDLSVTITVYAESHLPAELRLEQPLPDSVRLVLQRSLEVRGRFLDAQALPLPDAAVQIETGTRSQPGIVAPDGQFALHLPPDRESALIFTSPVSSAARLVISSGSPGERRDLGDIFAPPAGEVLGRLADGSSGAPVVGGRVWCPRSGSAGPLLAWLDHDLLETMSGEDGSFRLRGVPPGNSLLRVEARGFARSQLAVAMDTATSAVDLGEILLTSGATLRVLVGEGVEDGAVARVDMTGQRLEFDQLAASVVDGAATILNVAHGPATLWVVKADQVLCERELVVPAEVEFLEVTCRSSPLTVIGKVLVEGRTSGPGFLAWQAPAGKIPEGIMRFVTPGGLEQEHIFSTNLPPVNVPVNEAGEFHTTLLRQGPWEVSWLPAAGVPAPPQRVDLPNGSEHHVLLRFDGLSLFGTVVDGSGAAVAGARVRALESGAFALSSSDGTFELGGLQPGRHSLAAEFEDQASQIVQVDLDPRRQQKAATLILEEERRRPALEFLVLGASGEPAAGAFLFVELEGQGLQVLSTDNLGRASLSLAPLRPGRFRTAANIGGSWTFSGWSDLQTAAKLLTLAARATGSLVITSEDLSGTPRLVTTHGWEISDLLTVLGARPQVSPGAPLRITGLPEGDYRILFGHYDTSARIRGDDTSQLLLE